MLIAVPLIATGVSLLLGRTRVGKTVQAAASNADKARLSGINPKLVSTFVWTLSGLLAALTTVMLAGTKGQLVGLETLGPATLTRVLAAALIGSLVSFPRALTGGVVIGVLEALLRFNYPAQGGRIEALLFVGIAVSVWVITRRRRSTPQESFSFAPRVRPVPEALRQRWWVRNLAPLMALAGLAIAALLPLAITLPSRQFLWTEMLLTATLALSLVVLTGWTGQLSLGQAAFAGIGALGSAALVRGATLGVGVGDASFDIDLPEIPFLAAAIIMAAVCVCVALVIGLGALRVRSLMLAVVTLGFALAAQQYLWRTNFFSDGNATSVPLRERRRFVSRASAVTTGSRSSCSPSSCSSSLDFDDPASGESSSPYVVPRIRRRVHRFADPGEADRLRPGRRHRRIRRRRARWALRHD